MFVREHRTRFTWFGAALVAGLALMLGSMSPLPGPSLAYAQKGGGKGGGGGGGDGGPTLGFEIIRVVENGYVYHINDNGVVVGRVSAGDGTVPFVIVPRDADGDGSPDTWFVDDGQGGNALMTPLPTEGPDNVKQAIAINSHGDIVGDTTRQAALWRDGKFVDLGRLGPGFNAINRATSINNFGVIVGESRNNAAGVWQMFVIKPIDSDGDGQPDTWYLNLDGDEWPYNDLMVGISSEGRKPRINDRGWVAIPFAGLVIPEDANVDGSPDTWYRDDGFGNNALFVDLPPLNSGDRLNVWGLNSSGAVGGESGRRAVVWQAAADGSFTVIALPDPNVSHLKPKPQVTSTSVRTLNDNGMAIGVAELRRSSTTLGYPPCVWYDGKAALLRDLVTNPNEVDVNSLDAHDSHVNRWGEFTLNSRVETPSGHVQYTGCVAVPRRTP